MKHVNGKIRYDPRIDEPVGLCCKDFNSFENTDLIQHKLTSDDVYVPRECLVAGVASLTYLDPFDIILIWSSCLKKDFWHGLIL